MEDIEKIKSWCEVCQKEIIGYTKWQEHIKTPSHEENFMKCFMIDIGAMTLSEIPEKLEKYVENFQKNSVD